MRLINADDLIYEDIDCVDGYTYMVVHAPRIDKMPTAYDVDEVIEQINNLDIKEIPRYKGGAFEDYEGMDYYIKKSDVLEILKAGLM